MRNKIIFFLSFILWLMSGHAQAQPMNPPAPKCLAIDPVTGNITVTWTASSTNGNTFDQWEIYHSDQLNGTYTMYPVVSQGQLSFTIPCPPSSDADYVYMMARFNGGTGSVESDTLGTLFANITNTGNGTLNVQWNPLHTPALTTSGSTYRLFRAQDTQAGGAFFQFGNNIPNPEFEDTIRVCSDTIRYYVELDDLTGCTSVGNVRAIYFDNPPPLTPKLERATVVQATQLSRLDWTRSSSTDTKGYYIYQLNSAGSPVLIDSVLGWNNTTYTYALSNALNQSEIFRVAAFDSCYRVSTPSLFHNTIFLQAELDECNGISKLKWNPYNNWDLNVDRYEIYVSQNGSPFALLATLTSSDSAYDHFPLIQANLYSYFIRAINGDGLVSSDSNIDALIADVPIRPTRLYLKYATVLDPRNIKISIYTDPFADILKYRILKSKNLGDTYDTLVELPYQFANIIEHIDTAVFTNRQTYLYKAEAIDSCNQVVYTSDNIARTMFLKIEPQINLENTISWSDYESWNGGVRSYKVFRGFQGAFSDIPVSSVDFGLNSFEDNVADRLNKDGEYCYYIQAYQGLDTIFFFSDSSRSNTVCIKQEKTIYIPNAFTPEGENKIFKPNMTLMNPDNYEFTIYTKFGERIFETREPETGWDGTVNGKNARMDSYIYFIRYRDENFQFKEFYGSVTLVR